MLNPFGVFGRMRESVSASKRAAPVGLSPPGQRQAAVATTVRYLVTVLRKFADRFKAACREGRYTVRPFSLIENAGGPGREDKSAGFEVDFNAAQASLRRWCMAHYGEAFIAWAHVKVWHSRLCRIECPSLHQTVATWHFFVFFCQALRVFVESVLRYGLPVDFMSAIVIPHQKVSNRLRQILQRLYGDLAGPCLITSDQGSANTTGFYPYVCLNMRIT